jgi:putative Mg2+ transporter-C (MgtC) family protein
MWSHPNPSFFSDSTLRHDSPTIRDINRRFNSVLQGLIAGVGFLGAGIIILGTKQVETQGLTTAAGICVTAAIAMAAGMGRELTAVLSTLASLFVLSVVPWIHRAKKENKD